MKIIKATIENFRCFKGKFDLEFDTDGKITLFFGLGGAGKSTLLKFFSWVFYNEFSDNEQLNVSSEKKKPLYNQHLANKFDFGGKFRVFGSIEFIHNGSFYQIYREKNFVNKYDGVHNDGDSFILNWKNELGSWVEFSGIAEEKINEIIPKALSKYFFFHGESNEEFESDASGLENAIYSMFGLDKYKNAISHIGATQNKSSLIGKYNLERVNARPKNFGSNAAELLSVMTVLGGSIKSDEEKLEITNAELKDNLAKQNGLISKIGNASNKEKFEMQFNQNKKSIKNNEDSVKDKKKEIGNILYRNLPYLLLAKKAIMTKEILHENVKVEFTDFIGLKRELIEDVLMQGDCICGKKVDNESRNTLNNILSGMPPHSYRSVFGSFVKSAKMNMSSAENNYQNTRRYMTEITNLKNDNISLEEANIKLLDDIQSLEKYSYLVDEYNLLKSEEDILRNTKAAFEQKIKTNRALFKNAQDNYEKVESIVRIEKNCEQKIKILGLVLKKIKDEYNHYVEKAIDVLNKSTIDIYKKLSTKKEDFTKKTLLNPDFTLRSEYKTGSQRVIDVYSYVIGIVNALKSEDFIGEGNEFPIIIDAPFSDTDEIQIKNVVNVIPKISAQTVMLTLDIDELKKTDRNNFGIIWEIKYVDNEQTKSTISKGDHLWN